MKTILVTGSTDGIGREAARVLGERGARVLVHGRSRQKAERAVEALRDESGRDAFEPVAGDFASLDEVHALADDIAARWPRLDVILNNAGIYARTFARSADGFELTLAVNHLAPFALTHALLPTLDRGARIVFVSSNVHRSVPKIAFLDDENSWDGYSAYAQSKLMNAMTAFELARRLERRGITVIAMHPGVIGTKLLRDGFGSLGGADVARGAAGEVKLAIDPALDGVTGRYFDQTTESQASLAATDRTQQRELYEWSLEESGSDPP